MKRMIDLGQCIVEVANKKDTSPRTINICSICPYINKCSDMPNPQFSAIPDDSLKRFCNVCLSSNEYPINIIEKHDFLNACESINDYCKSFCILDCTEDLSCPLYKFKRKKKEEN